MRKFQKVTFVLFFWIYVSEANLDENLLQTELKNILLEHKIRASKISQDSNQNVSESSTLYPIRHNSDSAVRFRRDMPSIHMKKGKKKLRTCQNMNGILGPFCYNQFSLCLFLTHSFLSLSLSFPIPLFIHSFILSFSFYFYLSLPVSIILSLSLFLSFFPSFQCNCPYFIIFD